jgi:hypothetical protein
MTLSALRTALLALIAGASLALGLGAVATVLDHQRETAQRGQLPGPASGDLVTDLHRAAGR